MLSQLRSCYSLKTSNGFPSLYLGELQSPYRALQPPTELSICVTYCLLPTCSVHIRHLFVPQTRQSHVHSKFSTSSLFLQYFLSSFSGLLSSCNSKYRGSEVVSSFTCLGKSRVDHCGWSRVSNGKKREIKTEPRCGNIDWDLTAFLRTLDFILDPKRSHKGFWVEEWHNLTYT